MKREVRYCLIYGNVTMKPELLPLVAELSTGVCSVLPAFFVCFMRKEVNPLLANGQLAFCYAYNRKLCFLIVENLGGLHVIRKIISAS